MSDKYPGGFITDGAPAGYSAYFNGSSSSILPSSNASYAVSTGNFTIEAWLYWVSDTANSPTIFSIGTVNTTGGINIFVTSNTQIYVRMGAGGQDTYNTTTDVTFLGKWTHVAVVRNSGVLKIYLNGVSKTVTSTGAANSITASNPCIGAVTASNGFMNAYMSSLRYSNTAVYTADFTPPTLFNSSSSNNLLITLQNPSIVDVGYLSNTLTPANVVVSNLTPFPAYVAGAAGFNPALGAAAGGVWTIDQAEYYQNNRLWPIYDPYFKNTTLMLHGNGTNAAQNNTFLDSSTNNFTITRNGNTTQGTFTPFSQTGWSYNGTAGAYCQLNNADYAIGTGDFTIEFWMYCVDDSSYGSSAFAGLSGAGTLTVSMSGGSSNARQPYLEFGGTSVAFGTLYGYLNRWTHIAYVRTSGYVVVYQNGVATAAPISKSQSFPNCANLTLARLPTDTGQDFRGYLSNFRITKAAVYSSNFTPSTTPLTTITNTQLLTFQDNRFKDSSANNSTVTPAGTASVQNFSPFVPTTSTPITYSNWFDGSGDYLTAPSNAGYQFDSGNFTVEAWIYFNTVGNAQFASIPVVGALYWQYYAGALDFGNNAGGSVQASWTPSAGRWYHLAAVRNGATFTNYINGAVHSSGSAFNVTATGTLQIGYGGAGTFNGIISNFRIVKGTAVYTAAFTPPIAPLTNISGTSLLTCQSSTFVDNSSNALTITSYGNTQPVASPNPFGFNTDQSTLNTAYSAATVGGSGYFDGSGDYLSIASNAALNIGSSDITIEFWMYLPAAFASDFRVIFSKGNNVAGGNSYALEGMLNGTITLYVNTDGSSGWNLINGVSIGTPTVGAWSHVVVCRSGTAWYSFMNGVRVLNTTAAGTVTASSTAVTVGDYGSAGYEYKGYVSSLRLLKGTAAYANAATCTVPTAPFTNVANTSLLLNFTNAGIVDSTGKNVLETVGNAQISTTQSKFGGSSMYFDGTGDWLYMPSTVGDYLQLGGTSRPFTIEAWTYPTSFSTNVTIAERGGGNANWTSTTGIQYTWFFKNSDSKMYWQYYAGGTSVNSISSSVTISLNTWTHVAVSYDGTTTRLFVNGVQVGSGTTAYTIPSAPNQMRVGAETDGSNTFFGYIDDLRVTQGYARYTTTFTPPTSQLQDQ